MTVKEFLESKGFDDLREGLYHVFEQDEIESLLNEFAALPCSCEGGHYGYGAAKCFTCGRVKEVEKGNFNEPQSQQLNIAAVICSACGTENSIRWEKKEISIDDKQGSYKDLTFDFCEECGNVTNVDLS